MDSSFKFRVGMNSNQRPFSGSYSRFEGSRYDDSSTDIDEDEAGLLSQAQLDALVLELG